MILNLQDGKTQTVPSTSVIRGLRIETITLDRQDLLNLTDSVSAGGIVKTVHLWADATTPVPTTEQLIQRAVETAITTINQTTSDAKLSRAAMDKIIAGVLESCKK